MAIADRFDASVTVLTIVEPAGTPFTFDVDDVENIDNAFREVAEAMVKSGAESELDTEIRRGGPPYEEILAYADEIDADLIVAGRQGTTSLPTAVLGSTADRLARLSEIPVVLVPHDKNQT